MYHVHWADPDKAKYLLILPGSYLLSLLVAGSLAIELDYLGKERSPANLLFLPKKRQRNVSVRG